MPHGSAASVLIFASALSRRRLATGQSFTQTAAAAAPPSEKRVRGRLV